MPLIASKIVKLPFSNTTMHSHTGKVRSTGHGLGTGVGAVLLRTGGAGAGSSYMDMDDYISTTGINPYSRATKSSSGQGVRKLAEKLQKLELDKKPMSVRKNIVMNI